MIRRACYVVCDQCDGRPADISTHDAKDARDIARTEGYIRTPTGEDVCPVCAGKEWDGARWRWPASVVTASQRPGKSDSADRGSEGP